MLKRCTLYQQRENTQRTQGVCNYKVCLEKDDLYDVALSQGVEESRGERL